MAKKIIKAQMKQRLDTKANWAAQNPVLLAGELGIVSDDPNLYKVGDGATAWNALPFRGFDGTLAQETGTSENAAMSQKAVTEELAKLSEGIIQKSYGADAFSVVGLIYPDGSFANVASYHCTDFIPIEKNIKRIYAENLEFNNPYIAVIAFYDSSQKLMSIISDVGTITEYSIDIPVGAAYVRVTSYDNIENPSIRLVFEKSAIQILKDETAEYSSRINTLEEGLMYESYGANAFSFGGFVYPDGTYTDNSSYHCTDFLSLKNVKKIHTENLEYNNPYIAMVAFYDSKKNYLSNVTNVGSGIVEYDIDVPVGAAYVRISNINNLLSLGVVVFEYEHSYIDVIKDELSNTKVQRIAVELPNTIYAIVGDTLQIFFRSLMSVVNPYQYDILISCEKGKQYPRYFEYTPTKDDIGICNLTITLKDDNGNIVGQKSCRLVTKAVPNSIEDTNIVCFGDSLTAGADWCVEANRRLAANDGNPIGLGLTGIKFCGKKNKNGVGYFAEGGWRWHHYVTEGELAYRFQVSNVSMLSIGSVYTNNGSTFTIQEINVTNGSGNILCLASSAPLSSGLLTKIQGSGDASITYSSCTKAPSNPLWDANKGEMSFIQYANDYADGKLDIVYVLLGWNDVHREPYPYPNMMADCKEFLTTLHIEFPNAKAKIMGIQLCSLNGGLGANYGASGSGYADTFGTISKVMQLNLAYKELAESAEYSSFVEYVDIASQFDSEYNMPSEETPVNTRSSLTERRGINGVHPSIDGYMQIADVVYRNVVASIKTNDVETYKVEGLGIAPTVIYDGGQGLITFKMTKGIRYKLVCIPLSGSPIYKWADTTSYPSNGVAVKNYDAGGGISSATTRYVTADADGYHSIEIFDAPAEVLVSIEAL